jgi:hypothetical protein
MLASGDEAVDSGDDRVFDIDEFDAHSRGMSFAIGLSAHPDDSAKGGPRHELTRNLNVEREPLTDRQGLCSPDEESSPSEV